MKIYTRTGDDGSTGLFGGARVPKHDVRVDAYGTVDELNSILGLVAAASDDEFRMLIRPHQSELFNLGAMLAASDNAKAANLDAKLTTQMEAQIDAFDEELPPLSNFILPGGTETAARLHLARTVCRRAERAVSLIRTGQPKHAARIMPGLKYLNRLSDWLFTLARLANHREGVADVPWKGRSEDE